MVPGEAWNPAYAQVVAHQQRQQPTAPTSQFYQPVLPSTTV
jgi:hypothetical protein